MRALSPSYRLPHGSTQERSYFVAAAPASPSRREDDGATRSMFESNPRMNICPVYVRMFVRIMRWARRYFSLVNISPSRAAAPCLVSFTTANISSQSAERAVERVTIATYLQSRPSSSSRVGWQQKKAVNIVFRPKSSALTANGEYLMVVDDYCVLALSLQRFALWLRIKPKATSLANRSVKGPCTFRVQRPNGPRVVLQRLPKSIELILANIVCLLSWLNSRRARRRAGGTS